MNYTENQKLDNSKVDHDTYFTGERQLKTEGDCRHQWRYTRMDKMGERQVETKETAETSGEVATHQEITWLRDKWRLRETKETGETAETSGGTHEGIKING